MTGLCREIPNASAGWNFCPSTVAQNQWIDNLSYLLRNLYRAWNVELTDCTERLFLIQQERRQRPDFNSSLVQLIFFNDKWPAKYCSFTVHKIRVKALVGPSDVHCKQQLDSFTFLKSIYPSHVACLSVSRRKWRVTRSQRAHNSPGAQLQRWSLNKSCPPSGLRHHSRAGIPKVTWYKRPNVGHWDTNNVSVQLHNHKKSAVIKFHTQMANVNHKHCDIRGWEISNIRFAERHRNRKRGFVTEKLHLRSNLEAIDWQDSKTYFHLRTKRLPALCFAPHCGFVHHMKMISALGHVWTPDQSPFRLDCDVLWSTRKTRGTSPCKSDSPGSRRLLSASFSEASKGHRHQSGTP